MSAAKIPHIRARMRAQELLALELAGPVGRRRPAVTYPNRRGTTGIFRQAGRTMRQVIDAARDLDASGVTF